jgi:hypothetical protein
MKAHFLRLVTMLSRDSQIGKGICYPVSRLFYLKESDDARRSPGSNDEFSPVMPGPTKGDGSMLIRDGLGKSKSVSHSPRANK